MDTRIANNQSTNEGLAVMEMDTYLADERPTRNSDPLEWWRQKTVVYPRLSMLVKKFHCVLMNSVPCERVFSKMGQIITLRRNRLSVGKAAKIGCIAGNVPVLKEQEK